MLGFEPKTSGDFFFRAKNSFQKVRFNFPFSFPQSKSTIKISKNFTLRISRIAFLNRQNLAQKKKKGSNGRNGNFRRFSFNV